MEAFVNTFTELCDQVPYRSVTNTGHLWEEEEENEQDVDERNITMLMW